MDLHLKKLLRFVKIFITRKLNVKWIYATGIATGPGKEMAQLFPVQMIDSSDEEITLELSEACNLTYPYSPENVTNHYPNIMFLQYYCCDTDDLKKISAVFNGNKYLLFDEEVWARSNEEYWIQYDENGLALHEEEGWTHFDEEEWKQNKFENQWNKYTSMSKEDLIKFLNKIKPDRIHKPKGSFDIFDIKSAYNMF